MCEKELGMVRILVLLTCVIEGVSYQQLANLIRSLPNCNDDFGFEFDSCSAATGTDSIVNQNTHSLLLGSPLLNSASASASGR
jgi:hypothetical protein